MMDELFQGASDWIQMQKTWKFLKYTERVFDNKQVKLSTKRYAAYFFEAINRMMTGEMQVLNIGITPDYWTVAEQVFRTPQQQAKKFNEGLSQAMAGQSFHEIGQAFDLIAIKQGKIVNDKSVYDTYFRVAKKYAEEMTGIKSRISIDWQNNTIGDYNHIEVFDDGSNFDWAKEEKKSGGQFVLVVMAAIILLLLNNKKKR